MIFELFCKLGKKIRLTKPQWHHIITIHKEFDETTISHMVRTLQSLDFILFDILEENHQYYKKFKHTPVSEKYLLLIIKVLNDVGFVITSFFTKKIRYEGKVWVYGKKSRDIL